MLTRVRGCRAAFHAAAALAVLLTAAGTASAGTVTMTSCLPGRALPQPPWSSVSSAPSALTPDVNCASGGRLQLKTVNTSTAPLHAFEQWGTVLPAAMSLRAFGFPAQAALLSTTLTNHPGGGSSGYNARFISAAGSVTFIDDGQPCCGGMDYARPGIWAVGGQYFVFDVNCSESVEPGPGGCAQGGGASTDLLDIRDFTLVAEDDQPPTITAPGGAPAGGTNLWSGGSWVRGSFNLAFTAANGTGSGVCQSAASLGGQQLASPAGAYSTPDTTVWQQCPGAYLWQEQVNTAAYPNGQATLGLFAGDAAAPQNTTAPSRTIGIDNAPVGVSLTGPADVAATAANASTAITATASAGPSGANIFCSVDGSPQVEYSGASAQVPVSGLGAHQVICYAQNNAVDASGRFARSASQQFDVSIRQPTAEAVTFARIADSLRCHRVTVKVKVRGKARVIRRHGKRILVRGRTRIVKQRVRRCHARTIKRVVRVPIRHHGKLVKRHGKVVTRRKVIRVVVLPHPVYQATRRISHGKTTTVSGFLGLTNGTPLGGRPVSVIAAADNGLGQFTLPIASTTTSPYGTWTVQVPPGPSRLIEAVFPGDATSEPTTSAPVALSVPATIALSITPHQLRWSHEIWIRGRLVGGYVPPDGVALRLLVRYPGSRRGSVLLALRTNSRGAFSFKWSFYAGRGVATYPIWVATTATESDYPFAASAARRISVTFGRPTPATRRSTASHHKRRARHHQRHRVKHRRTR